MSWKFDIKPQAEKDLEWFRENNRQLYSKCFDLIRSLAKDPYTGIGKPERLKYFDENAWSRRVSHEHRLVYLVYHKEQEIDLVSFRYHYKKHQK
jgi:toxin YoeB